MWDNAGIHKTPKVRECLDEEQVVSVHIPPYSPWFNGCELMWAACKSEYRKTLTEYKVAMMRFDNDGLVRGIIAQHSQDQIRKWVRNAY